MIQPGTYFSTKDDIQSEILKVLNSATNKVFVAVAWLTDMTLFGKLKELQNKGVNVHLIVSSKMRFPQIEIDEVKRFTLE
jgi:HKD family nuclease